MRALPFLRRMSVALTLVVVPALVLALVVPVVSADDQAAATAPSQEAGQKMTKPAPSEQGAPATSELTKKTEEPMSLSQPSPGGEKPLVLDEATLETIRLQDEKSALSF